MIWRLFQPEFLQGDIAAGLFLELGEAGNASAQAVLFSAVGQEGGTRIFRRIALGRFCLCEGQPISSKGMVVSAFLPCHCAGLFFGPIRQGDCRRYLCLRSSGPEDHQIIARQFDLVEGRMIVGDDLAKVEPELLERGVAAGFSLKVGKADMPF